MPKYWSHEVMEHSDALDLDEGVFTLNDPVEIARSLKRSAEHSTRRKGTPYQSAMSMLNFYINRGGKNLTHEHLATLKRAKEALRAEFGREPKKQATARKKTPTRRTKSSATRKTASRRR